MAESVTLLSLGGIGEVTKNLHTYQYNNEILLVDCGFGFADETMLGVDLLLPDISYLLEQIKLGKKIVGLVLSHGHEDHIGALPFLLPQLPEFPIIGAPLTAALANEKLSAFGVTKKIKAVELKDNIEVRLGAFSASFIRVTHSIPDTTHILIKTPIGNFYHGSDFKFDLTPADEKKTDFQKIVKAGESGILCLLSDCLGAERSGFTPSEEQLSQNFESEMRVCKGKFIVTTYSSNISRLNQAIAAAVKFGRSVCFVGRSVIKAVDVAKSLGLLSLPKGMEIQIDQVKRMQDNKVLLIVAGSQGQENSAMTRIANGEHREIKLRPNDTVVFSSDPIPGNEVMVNSLVDSIARTGAKVLYSDISDKFHVSGHGSIGDLMLLQTLVKAKKVLPISGTYRHMIAYKKLAQKQGYQDSDIILSDIGQEIIFTKTDVSFGKKINIKNVYVDEISGEEIDSFIMHDRQKISLQGIVVIMTEVDTNSGQILGRPDIITRGFSEKESYAIRPLATKLQQTFAKSSGRVTNWIYIRRRITEIAEQWIRKQLKREPLVLPVVIEE